MKYFKNSNSYIKRRQVGFTIVELLIVIVIIAILAALAITAYTGLQARARDTQRKSDLALISKALNLYYIDNGNFAGAGSGCGGTNGNGTGWFNYENGSSYPTSTHNCLKNAGFISQEIIDPSGLKSCSGLSCLSYMKYTCGAGTYVYAHLESLPQTSTDTDGTCSSGLDTAYGMNYYVKVD